MTSAISNNEILSQIAKYGYCAKIPDNLMRDRDFILSVYGINPNFSFGTNFDKQLFEDKSFVLSVIDIYPNPDELLFRKISKELRDDRDVILACVKKNVNTIGYASERLRDDTEIVTLALGNEFSTMYGSTLRYCSNRFRDDKELVMRIVKMNPMAIEYASERLRDDTEIVTLALGNEFSTKYGSTLRYCSDRFRDDKELVMRIVKMNPMAIKYASERLRNDKDVSLMAIDNELLSKISIAYHGSLDLISDYISVRLLTNRDFVNEAIRIDPYMRSIKLDVPHCHHCCGTGMNLIN